MQDRHRLHTGAAMLRTAVAGVGFILAARTLARMLTRGDGPALAAQARARLAQWRGQLMRRGMPVRAADAAPAVPLAEEPAP